MPTSTLTLTRKYSLFESLLINVLNKLPLGRLQMEFPDGHTIDFGNGNEVKASMRITDSAFFSKCAFYGDVGFAESYLEGDWHTESISNVITWFILNIDFNPVLSGKGIRKYAMNFLRMANRLYHQGKRNTLEGSKKNIAAHYDLGNDFYQTFLDSGMTYSAGIFKSPDQSLEDAQTEKYDRLCRQLELTPDDHVLEIGSGWGGFAVHAVRHYGCRITTITISNEQFKYARERFRKEGLDDKIDIRLQDYRTLEGTYDKIVSIEMLEAVGHEFLPEYFKKCAEVLKPAGSIGLQVITSRDKRYEGFRKEVDFIQKYIFPGSQTPSLSALTEAVNKTSDLNLFDVKDIGLHYAKTLRLWFERFNESLNEVRGLGMDDYFIRKWNYYLQYCEAAFKVQHITVMQLIYKRPG